MNDMYEPNVSQAGQAGSTPYGQPMLGMGGSYDSLFQILWRGRWLILLCILLAGGGVYAYLQLATPMYTSTSRLLVDKPTPPTGSVAPQPAGSTLANYLATQAAMITSPEIVGAALRDPNLITLPTFSDPNYVQNLVKSLSADAARRVDIIEIKATSPYPGDAAEFANAVARAYIRWHEANRQLTTADLLKDLSSQLDKHYGDLLVKRKEQMLFEQRHPEVLETTPGGMIAKSLEVLRNALVEARLRMVEYDSYYQGLERLEKEPDAFREYVFSHQASAAAATVAATVASGEHSERFRFQTELEATQFQLADVQSAALSMGQRVSQVKMLQDRISDLTKKIADYDTEFVKQQVALAKTLLEDAHIQEQKVAEMYDKEFAKVQSLGDQDSQYAFLKSECYMQEQLYNTLLSQMNQLDLSARLEGLKIYVLEKALPAVKPSSPKAVLDVGIGLALALMLGGGLSLLRDWRDQRVRSPDEIAAILGVPVLGAIPSVPRRAIRRGQKLRFAFNSRESEACRAIRTALLCGVHREQTRAILVTSPGSQEGKTLLVSNLGMAMAQAGQRTLIIDADLRKPMKQRVFTTNGHSRGLADVLTGTAGLREVIRSADIDRLDILEGGASASNPSELLNSPAFATVLAQLKREYDRILIDSPPVGIVTDAQILATLCDVTLIVLRAEETSRILVQRARDALLAVGAQVAGAVVNDVSKRNTKYSYYGGYGYYRPNRGSSSPKVPCAEPATAAGLQAESITPPAQKKDHSSEGTPESLRADTDRHSEKGSLPVPIQEYTDTASRKETAADPDSAMGKRPVPAVERERNGGEAAPNDLATNANPCPEDGASARDKAEDRRSVTSEQSRIDAGSSPISIVATAEEKKNGRRTASDGPAMNGNPCPEEGASTGVKAENICSADDGERSQIIPAPPSVDLAAATEKKKNGRTAASDSQSTKAGVVPTDPAAQPQQQADGSPQPGSVAPIPKKKKDGRKATANRLPLVTGAQPQNRISIPEKDKSGDVGNGQGGLADPGPGPDAAALAAERWRRWLQGN